MPTKSIKYISRVLETCVMLRKQIKLETNRETRLYGHAYINKGNNGTRSGGKSGASSNPTLGFDIEYVNRVLLLFLNFLL